MTHLRPGAEEAQPPEPAGSVRVGGEWGDTRYLQRHQASPAAGAAALLLGLELLLGLLGFHL